MQAEMDRSMKRLKLKSFGPPYFIAYRLETADQAETESSIGGEISRSRSFTSTLYVEVRYGDRRFDNTDLRYRGWHDSGSLNPDLLSRKIWWLTDEAYKGAVAGYLRKKARRLDHPEESRLDDFSAEPPVKASLRPRGPRLAPEKSSRLARLLSSVLLNAPEVYTSNVQIVESRSRRYLLTSEGTRIATPTENLPDFLMASAFSRAGDGMGVSDELAWTFRGLKSLPPQAVLLKAMDRLASETKQKSLAPLQPPAAAPALLDPEFTGVLFHEALGHKLEGERQRDPDQSQVFKDLVGKRIIPRFLSLIDDPTLASFAGTPLHGHYAYDDEGVPAQKVVLVDHGILRNFLMSRWPIQGFPHSNGHGRADAYSRPTGRMAVLIVKAEPPTPVKTLRDELLKIAQDQGKPYAFYLVGSFGGDNFTSREAPQTLQVQPRLIYRVNAKTGAMTLVRGVRMVGTPLAVLNRIVAAGDDATLANAYFCGAESGFVSVSQIAPSVLLSQVELQRTPEHRARPPILPPPAPGKR
jgi:predicted Zn-dependent protease